MKTMPLHLKHIITPLLLALAVSQACAIEVVRIGVDGARGTPAASPGIRGGNGQTGGAALFSITTSDASSALALTGGRGGDGGYPGYMLDPEGEYDTRGGEGAAGGLASGYVNAVRASGNVTAQVNTVGGSGGRGSDSSNAYYGEMGGSGGQGVSSADVATGTGNANVEVNATGGSGGSTGWGGVGSFGLAGGSALARGTATALNGTVTGVARAQIGSGTRPVEYWNMVDATAELTLTGSSLVSGQSSAVGMTANATLTLRGAGASGTASARGDIANSLVRATTTGRSVVDLTAFAQVDHFGNANADLYVDAGYSSPAAGNATVTGKALASAGSAVYAGNTARVTLLGSGAIVGVSEARGSDGNISWEGCYDGCQYSGGTADSYASGITRGNGNVTLTALAVAGKNYPLGNYGGGAASAVASGQSGSGRVIAKAEAHSFVDGEWDQVYKPAVHASATTLAAGGSTYAEATHVARESASYAVLAEASSVGSGGARAVAIGIGNGGYLESRASASGGGLTVTTYSNRVSASGAASIATSANVGGAVDGLPGSDSELGLVSYATGAPASATTAALLESSPELASTDANWLGAGGYAYNSRSMLWGAGSTTEYTFTTGGGQHLLLGLFGAQGIVDGTFAIDFTVRNNGVVLFTQFFDDAALAGLKGAQLLDLGVLGAGLQNLTLATEWYVGGYDTAYGFQYVMGVSAVPEPTTWLAMLLGLGTLALVARRRRP
jgi:hypothetical protein